MFRILGQRLLSGTSGPKIRFESMCCRPLSTSGSGDKQGKKPETAEETADRLERELVDQSPTNLTDIDGYRVAMPSLLKEVFVGKFNNAVCSYPDVLPKDRYEDLERRCQKARETFQSKRDLVDKIDQEKRVPKDLLMALRSQGFYGLNVPKEDGGQGLSMTESCRLMEELSVDMSLSETVSSAANIGYKSIQLYGSEDFKKAHLEKFAQGIEIMALCMADSGAGSDAASSSTVAYPEENTYVLTGKKLWVTNADSADFFTVFANVIQKDESAGIVRPYLTAFVVPKTAPGVRVLAEERHGMAGLKGVHCAPVEFDKVVLTHDQVLGIVGDGFEVLNAVLSHERLMTCARISSGLRNLLNATVRHAVSRKTYGKKLIDFELIQGRLGDAASHLYALESMVFMTAGISDNQKDIDVNLETAACKRFANKTINIVTENCLSVLGSRGYLENSPDRKFAEDLKAYQWWDSTDDILSMYIAVSGISVAGTTHHEAVREQRNPLLHPWKIIEKFKKFSPKDPENFKRTLEISDFLHPSLFKEGDILEYFVQQTGYLVMAFLIKEGTNAPIKEMDLARLSDLVVHIYAMASASARASRSFTDGHEHGLFEVQMAKAFVRKSEQKLKVDVAHLMERDADKHDIVYNYLGEYMKEKGCYPAVHPIKKYFF